MSVLESIAGAGGLISNEHPKDPARDPYPSTWNLSEMKRIEAKFHLKRVVFPQCMWGQVSRKDTCISSNLEGIQELDVLGNGRCCHKSHDYLFGLDENGNFKTRQAQTYPSQLCEKIAQLYVRNWESRLDIGEYVDVDEFGKEETEEESLLGTDQEDQYCLGERVPAPEVGRTWDNLARWKEEARWVWKLEEHNNILEARAGVISAKRATMTREHWNKRHLLISDSQVAIGVFGKGRSSAKSLNMLARRLASIALATGSRFYWRYIRTHRNHADGPSRGEPLGVAPKTSSAEEMVSGLTDFFYKHTKG